MRGTTPDHHPFVTRLETWYKSHLRSGTLPERFAGMSLNQVNRAVGVGQLKFMVPYALRLRGVEVSSTFEGDEFYREFEPLFENFPGMWDIISNQKAGITRTELKTPVGSLYLQHEMLQEGIFTATEPYLREHLIKGDDDYRVVEYILERAEFVPLFNKIVAEQARLGDIAFVVPLPHRIPFQQVLLEYLGEAPLFYALYDNPRQVERLLDLLDEQLTGILKNLASLQVPYVEFPDNLHGMMTNPKLFQRYCLPHLQHYTGLLHAQGKKAGSHTDGDVKPLLKLLAGSGLDVCESVSPTPLTPATIEEIWDAWQGGPVIWGAIPTPILEERTPEAEFRVYIERLLDLVGQGPIILGLVDLFMRHNSIERVKYIAARIRASG
ncbi:MAG: hypothetical protein HGA82_01165 [Anaerolineales bacterium]|nr:hypothetical protein [Anaerolineales bacterium]